MTRYAITSYPQLEDRMRSGGHVFDCGQICPSVLSQAYGLAAIGVLRISLDSWPIRGFAGRESRTVFELVGRTSSSVIPSKS